MHSHQLRFHRGGKTARIRDGLKSWSAQNELEKRKNAPDTIPATGRLFSLPQSYFLPQPTEEDDDVELDAEGEVQNFTNDSYDYIDIDAPTRYSQPGDLVLVRPKRVHSVPQTGVYMGSVGRQDLFILRSGRYLVHSPHNAPDLVQPGFAMPEEIADVKELLPKQPVQRETLPGSPRDVDFLGDEVAKPSHPLIKKMTSLSDQVAKFQRDNVSMLDTMYERFAHETEYIYMAFDRMVKALVGAEPPWAARWAIFHALKRDNTRLKTELMGTEPHTLVVMFLPKKDAHAFADVVEWTRQYQDAAAQASSGKDVASLLKSSPITPFIEKCRRIIIANRKLRSPTTTCALGPCKHQLHDARGIVETQPTGESWSETDKMVLEFMWATYCRKPASMYATAHTATASLILRAVGAYPKMVLNKEIGKLFLQEVGTRAPWHEPALDNINTPYPGRKGSEAVTRLRVEAVSLAKELGFDTQTPHNPMPDLLVDIRQDFPPEQTIFCIDGPFASVLDDGVSIERSGNDPSSHWFHVHIAHPGAFFDQEHVFGRLAREQLVSLYTPHSSDPMLPPGVGKAISLGSAPEAMTISTLVSEAGKVLDIKIQATRLRNVVRLESEAVYQAMRGHRPETAYLVVGTDPVLKPEDYEEPGPEAIAAAHKYMPTLELMDKLLSARSRARNTEGGVALDMWEKRKRAGIATSSYESFPSPGEYRCHHYMGDPTVKFSITRHVEAVKSGGLFDGGGRFIDQAMVLACESLGKWCRDRNIPVVYNGVEFHPNWPVEKINQAGKHEVIAPPKRMNKATPIFLGTNNIKQYVKATSPLRRFQDLLVQWNVMAYLQAEAKGIVAPGAPVNDDVKLPWTLADVEDFIANDIWRVNEMQKTDNYTSYEAVWQAFFRAFHFNEAKLPEIWDCEISYKINHNEKLGKREDSSGIFGKILPWHLRCLLVKSKQGYENNVRAGEYIPVKIDLIDPIAKMIHVVAVGPSSETFTQLDPIKIWSLEGKEEEIRKWEERRARLLEEQESEKGIQDGGVDKKAAES